VFVWLGNEYQASSLSAGTKNDIHYFFSKASENGEPTAVEIFSSGASPVVHKNDSRALLL
jgi:hypothetical protein